MTIDDASRFMASELLKSHWKPSSVAERVRCHPATVYRWERNLQVYGSLNPHRHGIRGRPRRLTSAAKEALLEYLDRYPWAYQDELASFLKEEWDIQVSKPTICRFLKENRLSRQQQNRGLRSRGPDAASHTNTISTDISQPTNNRTGHQSADTQSLYSANRKPRPHPS